MKQSSVISPSILSADFARLGEDTQAVLDATDRLGVDIVCDLVGGDVTRESLACLAYGGRLVLTGFSGGIEAEDESGLLPRPIIFANASVAGVLMAYGDPDVLKGTGVNLVPRARGVEIEALLEGHLAADRIRPIIGRKLPFSNLPSELERMERRETMGRSILDWTQAIDLPD